MRSERGSISIFLAILMPVLLFLLSFTHQYLLAQRIEVDLARRAKHDLELARANYDRELYQRYRLFGIREGHDFFDSSPYFEGRDANLELSLKDQFSEPDLLKSQIRRQMKLRSPLVLVKEVLTRLDSPALDQLANFRLPLIKLPSWGQTSLDPKASSALELLSNYTNTARSFLAPSYEALDIDASSADLLSSRLLTELANKAEGIMEARENILLDKVHIMEYLMSYFSQRVNHQYVGSKRLELKALDGRLKKDFPAKSEVERIIFSQKQVARADFLAAATIGGIRFVVRLAHICSDEVRMNQFLVTATVISAILAIASGSGAAIPPELIRWIIVLGTAAYEAKGDVDLLLEGKALAFWPDYEKAKLYYHDYLRFIILILPESRLLKNTASLIEENLAGTFYVTVNLKLSYRGRGLVKELSYVK